MKFALATLYVTDMPKSLVFYNQLLEIPILGNHENKMVFLGLEGHPGLELIATDTPTPHSGFSIGFEVPNMDAITARLAQNGYPIKRQFSPDGTTKLCFLDGPDGEEVELIQK